MIRAMGGQLKIEAVFPEGRVKINQFRKLKKGAGADRESRPPQPRVIQKTWCPRQDCG